MKTAILSDIHSNLVALQAVLDDIETQRVDRIVCLGDIVGYGPAPNECVQKIQQTVAFCLIGNHDSASLGLENLEYFNEFAREAVIWTKKQLTSESKNYLESLPFIKIEKDITFVHGAPHKPERWDYIISMRDAQFQFKHLQTQLCFIGHSHIAGAFKNKGQSYDYMKGESIQIDESSKYFINVGAVGQPRDFDARASYGILDSAENIFHFRRVPYDIQSTQDQMRDANLPGYLIDRLSIGR